MVLFFIGIYNKEMVTTTSRHILDLVKLGRVNLCLRGRCISPDIYRFFVMIKETTIKLLIYSSVKINV